MPILLFLLDTSASMNQRTYLGTTFLDVAKGAVEIFMKLRARDPASRGDRYMLVTFDDSPYGVKAGWKENHATFMCELKNLQASGLTTLGYALRAAFDLLNLNRLVSGIDNYGQGRNPFYLEPAVIITITDGNKLTHSSGVPDETHTHINYRLCICKSFKKHFKILLFILLCAYRVGHILFSYSSVLIPLFLFYFFSIFLIYYCVATVGKVQFSHCGINKAGSGQVGMTILSGMPLPHSYPLDPTGSIIELNPPRSAHPVVRFSCVDCEPMVIDKLPFDKYELEPSPLTQFILERKSPHSCWQVFVSSSMKQNDLGQPFGYLKASTTLTCVNLFVMPYNYPVLLPLLDDLFKVHKLKPNVKWRQAFEIYLKTMPPYYLMVNQCFSICLFHYKKCL
uniref:Integrator complex subunit 6 like n=1 Tax=Tetraodon nigroviridis TaxID=99883 RepID=H3BYE9_TETNG